ncbi:unnamed protein product [Calypogeia fissa]
MAQSSLAGQLQRRRIICLIFAALALFLVLFYAAKLPSVRRWRRAVEYGRTVRHDEKSWEPMTNLLAEWEIPRIVQDGEDQNSDQNSVGLQKLRTHRAVGSLWWDERAEQYFMSKLEASQFPADCSHAHWIAHYEWGSGLLSDVHIFLLPLFFAMVRGHTLVPISEPFFHHAFNGCGPKLSHLNMQCFFNVTNCNPAEDTSRLSHILEMRKEMERTTWEEVLMEEVDYFSPGGVTVIRTWKMPAWGTEVCVASSVFSSYVEAFNYNKLTLWDEMGHHGKVGIVTAGSTSKCPQNEQDLRARRVDLVLTSLMSSWMLNRMPSSVKLVADKIMSRYTDTSGQPLWKSPVLAIHIRQTDKLGEDPYFSEHGVYRPVEDYAIHMKQLEKKYGFQFPSIFLISDSGTALESMMSILNGNESAAPPQHGRYVMHDWTADDHLVEKFNNHANVSKGLKHDMQTHFLATLYIVQKIADHAIVTHSSNVGRFIAEIMAAKHRLAFVDREGPLVTSLDNAWVWHYDIPGF